MATSAERKYDALIFWGNHGLSATQDAFEVSRSTLYVWRKRYREGGLSALHDASTAPRNRRRRRWPSPLKDEIKRLRERHPNIGKEKLHVLLAPWCDEHGSPHPSVSTIGRLIADDPHGMRKSPCRLDRRGRRKRRRSAPRLRLPKGHRSAHAGQVVSLDTITRFRDGIRYHVFTATDHATRFGMAAVTSSATSRVAAGFLRTVQAAFPGHIKTILTDNGSEYQGAFDEYLKREGIKHCYTYPHCPKMNALSERFNRTVQEEFVEYHENALLDDLHAFNNELFAYLERYNAERPHRSLENMTPCQALAKQLPHLSSMWWTHTMGLKTSGGCVKCA